MAKKGAAPVGVVDSLEVVVGTAVDEDFEAAAAAACKLAILLCKKSGTPEKARKFEASLSAASWRFHLFRRF